MASIWRHPRSPFWVAAFRDARGTKRNRSTKVRAVEPTPGETMKARRRAQRLADSFEDAARNQMTVEAARRVVGDLQAELGVEQPEIPTTRAFVAGWIERRTPTVAPATTRFHRTVERKLMAFLEAEKLADAPIDRVTREHMTRWRNAMAEKASAATVNLAVKGARSMFADAVKDGHLTRNPLEHVEGLRARSKAKRRPFTQSEIEAVLAVAAGEWRSLFLLGLGCGQRLADLAALRWSQVDLERREIRITTRKTGRSLVIPMAAWLVDHFAELEAGDDPTGFVHPDAAATLERRGGSSGLSKQFRRTLDAAGLQDAGLTFHSTRHTCVTRLHEQGVPPATVRALIGHEDGASAEGYITIGEDALRAAAAKLEAPGS